MTIYPFARRWCIDKDDVLGAVNGTPVTSSTCTEIPNISYFFLLYPNGIDDSNVGKCVLQLVLNTTGPLEEPNNVFVKCVIAIESASFSTTAFAITRTTSHELCTRSVLVDPYENYIAAGKLILQISGSFDFHDFEVDVINNQKWTGSDLGQSLWENVNAPKDVIFVVGNQEIPVHKLIIQSHSSVLAKKLQDMKASDQGKLEIEHFEYDVVFAAVKIMYDCKHETFLNVQGLLSLLKFFHVFEVARFVSRVEDLLIAAMDATNVVDICNNALALKNYKLEDKCVQFLRHALTDHIAVCDIHKLDKDFCLKMFRDTLHHDIYPTYV